jgi:hypothetical protein
VITEWNLDRSAADLLINEFTRRTGDDLCHRIAPYVLAYAVFRMSYCKMALSSVAGTPEYGRLQSAAAYYRNIASEHLNSRRTIQSEALPAVPSGSMAAPASAAIRTEPAA